METNQEKQYWDAINKVLDKMKECIYDALSSFAFSPKYEMIVKLGKINWYCELLNDIVPEDFDKSILKTFDQHIGFLNHFYTKNKDFDWFKSNTVDLIERDIPTLKSKLKEYLIQASEKETTKPQLQKLANPEDFIESQRQVEIILRRFHLAAKEVAERHNGRTPFKMNDEYDVQDLLEGLLKVQFDDVRREDHTPLFAGSSNRIDFVLAKERIGIEAKRTREGLTDGELGKQLINDIGHYKEHPKCKTLYFFVYDPEEFIKNPSSIENDLNGKYEGIDVKVLIMPKRG